MCIWGDYPAGSLTYVQVSVVWQMVYAEEFWGSPPSQFKLCNAPLPLPSKQIQSMMLRPACLIVGTVFLEMNASSVCLQTYLYYCAPSECILFVRVARCKLHSSLKVLNLEQGLLSWFMAGLYLGDCWIVPDQANSFSSEGDFFQTLTKWLHFSIKSIQYVELFKLIILKYAAHVDIAPRDIPDLCKALSYLHWAPWTFHMHYVLVNPVVAVRKPFFCWQSECIRYCQSWPLTGS